MAISNSTSFFCDFQPRAERKKSIFDLFQRMKKGKHAGAIEHHMRRIIPIYRRFHGNSSHRQVSLATDER
jgi:hypothetical protein